MKEVKFIRKSCRVGKKKRKEKCWITKRTVFFKTQRLRTEFASATNRSQRFESSLSSHLSGTGGFSVTTFLIFSNTNRTRTRPLIELANGRRDLSSKIASRSSCSSARKLLALTIFLLCSVWLL